MPEPKLRDKATAPTDEVLRSVTGSAFAAYEKLRRELGAMGIVPEWRYYRDGNTWLEKMPFRKKNLGWIHVYDGYFNVTCFFMDRHFPSIDTSDLSPKIKESFRNSEHTGKLMPMTVEIHTENLPEDLLKMLRLKMGFI